MRYLLFAVFAALTASCTTQWGDGAKFSMLEDRKLLQSNIAYLKEEKAKCDNYYYEWKEEFLFDSIKSYSRGLPIPEKPREVQMWQDETFRIDKEIQLNMKELDSLEIILAYKYNYSF